jgi:DNA-binding response OmpR family regulator
MRVLIVEDEYLIARTLAQMLTDGGHVVTGVVGSAEKAIQMLEDRKCDVAVVYANLANTSAQPSGLRIDAN